MNILQIPCMHPLCARERTFPADPSSILGWHSRPNVDQLPERGTFKPGAPIPIPDIRTYGRGNSVATPACSPGLTPARPSWRPLW
jgi:hypothetical protein